MRSPILLLGLAALAAPLSAQAVRVGVAGAAVRVREVTQDQTAHGIGPALSATYDRGRFTGTLQLVRARLTPDDSAHGTYTLTQADLRVAWHVQPALDVEVGLSRRFVSPEFATEDVGALSFGVHSSANLSSAVGVWARLAWVPVAKYNAGGSTGEAYETGLGVWVAPRGPRLRATADFSLQRLDRRAHDAALPIQATIARIGVEYRL